jgi:hypothetical protein
MALRDQPYLPLYVQDFLTDEKLADCSAAATGVYIRLMCLMHKSEKYGTILLKQKYKQTLKQEKNFASQIARQMPYSEDEIERSLIELLRENVVFLDGDALCQKRMIRDCNVSEKRSQSGSKGGKKTASKLQANEHNEGNFASSFASDFAQAKSQANTEIEIEDEDESKNMGKGGTGEKTKKNKKCQDAKMQFAEFVSMTNAEYQALVTEHGENAAQEFVKILDNYKGANGKKYKSDYRAILNWVINSYNERKSRKTQNQGDTNIHRLPKDLYVKQ